MIGARDVWNPDEPRYAQIAREMSDSGAWFVPHLNDAIYREKPPLLFWCMAASAKVFGWNAFAVRLPSVLAAVLAALSLFVIGARTLGRAEAWAGALVFVSCGKILWQAQVGQIDMLLTGCVTAAMACYVIGRQERSDRWTLGFWLLTGIGTLAKGPVALFPPLIGILVWLLWRRDRAGFKALCWGRGVAVHLAVLGIWLVPGWILGGEEYLPRMVLKQTVERYANPWHHVHPWYYYLKVLPVEFLPWSLALPGALLALRREREDGRRGALALAAAWVIATLVFFSVSSGKRTVYILTLYPALALLTGAGLVRLREGFPRGRAWLAVPPVLLAGLLLAALPRVAGLAAREPQLALGAGVAGVQAGLGALALALLASAFFAWRGAAAALPLAAGAFLALNLGAGTLLLPRYEPVKSSRALGAWLAARLATGEKFATWEKVDAPALFYSRRFAVELYDAGAVNAWAARPEANYFLVPADRLAGAPIPEGFAPVFREADSVAGYVVFARPESAAP